MRISDWSSDVCSSDLAEAFYERGPRRGKARLAVWMAEKMVRGELRRGDPPRAVYHLAGMLQSGLYQVTVLNPIGRTSCRERGGQYASISVVAVSFKKNKRM